MEEGAVELGEAVDAEEPEAALYLVLEEGMRTMPAWPAAASP